MKIGAKEVLQGIGDMKRKHHCLRQPSRKIPGCKIRGMFIRNVHKQSIYNHTIPPCKSLSKSKTTLISLNSLLRGKLTIILALFDKDKSIIRNAIHKKAQICTFFRVK